VPADATASGNERHAGRLIGGDGNRRHCLRVENDTGKHQTGSSQSWNNFHHIVSPLGRDVISRVTFYQAASRKRNCSLPGKAAELAGGGSSSSLSVEQSHRSFIRARASSMTSILTNTPLSSRRKAGASATALASRCPVGEQRSLRLRRYLPIIQTFKMSSG
jgi:hypothetical protein